MEIIDWKKLFKPHILERGLDYYESELVKIERVNETGIEAFVEGTDQYSVRIVLQKGHVTDMDCDCPYAADGKYCKHMAAVLFAADDVETSEADLIVHRAEEEHAAALSAEEELSRAVSALSEEQLRNFLLEAALKHDDIRNRLLLRGKKVVEPSTKKLWQSDLRAISRSAAGRGGFIDYRNALDYTISLEEYLDETIAPLLENHLIMDAFELVGLVYTEVMKQDMDDSDGGTSSLISRCESYWEYLIPAPEADQKKMLDWFSEEIRKDTADLGEYFLLPVVYGNFTDPKLLPEIFSMIDRQIESASEFGLIKLVRDRISLMERMGMSAQEINAYKRRFWKYPFIRNQELDRLEAEEQWGQALALLEECEKLDEKEKYLLARYSERRVKILKKTGTKEAWLEALKRYVFSFPQREMTYIEELKATVSSEEWKKILPELFRNANTRDLRRKLQISEGLLEQMMSELEANNYPYEIREYEKELRKIYPERVRDLLLKMLDMDMRRAQTRSAYAEVAQSLKHLYGYPEGRKKAADLAASWRRDFSRRSAMKEELERVKL